MWTKLLGFISICGVATAAAVALPRHASPYDAYKVYRVKTGHQLQDVQQRLSTLSYEKWNHDVDSHIDVLLAPDQVEVFESLGLRYRTMHEDLGASIAAESAKPSKWKRQSNNTLAWWDSYHPYDDHKQFVHDLSASFPDNSEIISSGTSYEGRDIFGIHLWGKDGPGKPAVLYHGTVHAREWISAPVSRLHTLETRLVSDLLGQRIFDIPTDRWIQIRRQSHQILPRQIRLFYPPICEP